MNLAQLKVFINELLACLHFLRVHWIGFSYFQNEGLLKIYGVVKSSLRRKFPVFWFVNDLGVFGILWRKFLLYFFCCLS